jgi:hypothetical protein
LSFKPNLICRFEVSSKSGPSSEVASNLVATAKHQLTSNVEPLRKRQKPLQGDRTPPDVDAELTPWTVETFNHDVQKTHPSAIPPKPSAAMITWVGESPIEEVQKSYRSAIRDGRLKYHREPELVSEPVGLKPWDPYVLTAAMVSRARLDSNKVASITQNVNSTVAIVPKAFEWMAKTQEYNLAPEDVKRILQRAFVHDESSSIQQSKQVGKLPPILRIAAGALRRAEELQDRPDDFRREEAILRMVAYASTEVSVVAGEATNDEVSTVGIVLFTALIQGGRYLDRTTGWWEGLAEAMSLDCPLLVLVDEKFVLLEGSRLTAVFHAK